MSMRRTLAVVALVGCSASAPPTQPHLRAEAPPPPRPIPTDLVFNAFTEQDGGTSLATPSVGGDAGVPSEQEVVATKLLSPGANPRRSLAYAFVATPRTVRCRVTMTPTGNAPPSSYELAFVATPKLTADGATIDVRLTKLHIARPAGAGAAVAKIAAELESAVVGKGGSFDAEKNGLTTSFAPTTSGDTKTDDVVARLLPSCVETQFVALPTEPVGVGAKWELTRTLQNKQSPTTTATFTLEAMDSRTATVAMVFAGAGVVPVSDERAPAGTTVTSTQSGSYRIVARRDGVSQSGEGSMQAVVTQHVPSQPDQTVSIRTSVRTDSP